jgi:hypothetical protein
VMDVQPENVGVHHRNRHSRHRPRNSDFPASRGRSSRTRCTPEEASHSPPAESLQMLKPRLVVTKACNMTDRWAARLQPMEREARLIGA